MPIEVICAHLLSLCDLSKHLAGEVNRLNPAFHLQPTTIVSVVVSAVLSGLVISLIAGLSFISLIKVDMASSGWLYLALFGGAGIFLFGPSELAFLVVIKFCTFCLLAVFSDDLENLTVVGLLGLVALLLLIVQTRYNGQTLPALIKDAGIAAFGCFLCRAFRYFPYLPWLALGGIAILILHGHGLGVEVLTEMAENFAAAITH
jgi:hypothetical protein